jgi:predicted nucleic acid-binding protein
VILLDTSGVIAWIDAAQTQHAEIVAAMAEIEPPFFLSPFVLAELDYLLATRVGANAQIMLLEEVARGSFVLEELSANDVGVAHDVIGRYPQLAIGLAEASIVILAERRRCFDVLTLDERHYRAVRGLRGERFRLLPADRA